MDLRFGPAAGFLYVGAGALALLALAVIILGLTRSQSGVAEALAVLGFFGTRFILARPR